MFIFQLCYLWYVVANKNKIVQLMRLVDQRMCRQKCRLFYTMFIIKMSNFGTKENFCEVYNSSLKCFIFLHHERDTRTFFFRWAMWTTGFRYGNMMKFATVLIDLRLFCRCVIVCRIYHPMKTSYQWQSGEEIAQHSLNREGAMIYKNNNKQSTQNNKERC